MAVSSGNSYAFLEFPTLFENDGRVVGGMDANLGQFPYQVALARKSGSAFCGGSLITSMLVLTAAHCLRRPDKQPNQIVVISGNHKLGSPNQDEQIVDVSGIIVHEDYNYKNYLNDIAIILLAKEISMNTNTNTISLPTEGTQFQKSAIVSGWGYQAYRGTSTNILQYANVELLNHQACRQKYEPRRRLVGEGMLCAFGKEGEDACKSDSGGPLACKGLDGKTYLCGIVSWGEKCGIFPGVYTNVAKFLGWIKSKEGNSGPSVPSLTIKCRVVGAFQCTISRKCIPGESKCDGQYDCGPGDQSDETGCHQKSSDGRIEDGTAIVESPCDAEEFYCSSSDQYIHKMYLCDGTVECPDISLDEVGCDPDGRIEITPENPCDQNYFYCASSDLCIPNEDNSNDEVCPDNADDGRTDVDDSFNTADALGTCNFGDFHCEQSNLCISSTLRCNGNMDCDLGEDEDACEMNYHDQRSVDFEGGNDGPLDCDRNDWECTFSESSVPDTDGRIGDSPCDDNFFYCVPSNLCIPSVSRCNGQYDCGDGDYSDEEDCPEFVNPESDENVEASFMNDNVDDSPCDEDHFYCDILSQCLPHGYHCGSDGETRSGDQNVETGFNHESVDYSFGRNVEYEYFD